MKKLRIVILSGSIFPSLSPRSFRSTELAKGFAKMGHEVTLYGLNGEFNYSDFEKQTGVKVKSMGKSWLGNRNNDGEYISGSYLFRLFRFGMTRIFKNIIDYPRSEFFFKAIKVLKQEESFDYLITIAHPYGLHWGTAYFKKYKDSDLFKVWTSDCGDPFMMSANSKRWPLFLKPIEKFWGRQTDFITIPVGSSRKGYYQEMRHKIEIIPQSIDFEEIELAEYKKNPIPTFLYSGGVMKDRRDPTEFLKYLLSIDKKFKFVVYTTPNSIFHQFGDALKGKLEILPYIPRLELIKELSKMDFLINFKNNKDLQSPSKLIDYGISGRPIIDISGTFLDKEKNVFEEFLNGNYQGEKEIEGIAQYDSKNVCTKFIDLYERKQEK